MCRFKISGSRIVLLALPAVAAVIGVLSPAAIAASAKPVPAFKPVLVAEAKSQALCESKPGRIFVANAYGSECIAYFVTKGFEQRSDAVVFLDGDMSAEKFADPAGMETALANTRKGLQNYADKLKVRYVMIARVGLNGSSGNHGERRKPRETHLINSAIDLLKLKLGLTRIALAGQSGGSTISASLLSFGRKDVACAALGSGAYELVELQQKIMAAAGQKVTKAALYKAIYDPASHVGDIAVDTKRRVFVIGDHTDTRTPFDQQRRYVESLNAAGHHGLLIPIEATGDLDHSAAAYALPTAGGCLKGTTDAQLIKANAGQAHRIDVKEAAASPAASGSAALLKSGFQAGK